MELNTEHKFITHDENNIIINKVYDNNNYVIDINKNGIKDLCYIFFSSNGLYNLDDKFSFQEEIINKNKYEWKSLSKSINAYKKIYIRDIWLSWYVKGINSRINTIDLLIDWIKEETKGYKVKIVGMSSGGYIGALISSIINAEMCFCFSGQFSLKNHNNHINDNILLKKYYDSRGKWYDIYEYIKQSKVNIVYFFPEYVEHDKIQSNFVKLYKNVLSISFKSKLHSKTIFSYDYQKVLNMNIEDLRKIENNINNKPISALKFSYKVNGLYKCSKLFLKKIINKLILL